MVQIKAIGCNISQQLLLIQMRRINNRFDQESSESSLSDTQQRNQATFYHLSRNPRLTPANQQLQYESSDEQSSSSEQFNKPSKAFARNQSDSQDSLDKKKEEEHPDNVRMAATRQPDLSNSSEDSSSEEEEEEQFNQYPLHNRINTVREDSGEDSDDESIDHIQQRIKKLEKDLEQRLGEQKQKEAIPKPKIPSKQTKPQKTDPQPIKNASKLGQPPAPHSKPVVQPPFKPVIQPQNENKMGDANTKPKPSNHTLENEQSKPYKNKKASRKESNPESKAETKETKSIRNRPRTKKQSNTNEDIIIKKKTETSQVQKSQDLSELEKMISKLQKQNEQLRGQIQKFKQHQPSKNPKKPQKQLEELRQLSKDQLNLKLEKEIELLQVVEKLESKLKKSINKKLAHSKGGVASAVCLQKGLPTSLLRNQ